MATRLYLGPTTTSPQFYLDPVSFDPIWNVTSNAEVTGRLFRDKLGYELFEVDLSKGSTVLNDDRLLAAFVSNQLIAQTITGTAKAVAMVREQDATHQLRSQMVIRVMSADLQTERGVLYAGDTGALTTEWAAAASSLNSVNRYFPQGGTATLSPVVAQDGDRLLVELGYRSHLAASGSGGILLGDATGVSGFVVIYDDLPDDETNTVKGAPWVEFTQDLMFKEYHHGNTLYENRFIDVWSAEFDTDTVGVDSAIDVYPENTGRMKVGISSDSDCARAILDVGTLNVSDADVYLRFRHDSAAPTSQSHTDPVVCCVWLRGDGTWNPAPGNNERPDNDGLGFEWWNNRPGTKIVEIFGGSIFHPSTDFECLIRPSVGLGTLPVNWVRMRVEGTYAAMKMWRGNRGDEPADWQIESHAVQVTGPGQFQIACKRDNGNGVVITSMLVDDLDIGDCQLVPVVVGDLETGTF